MSLADRQLSETGKWDIVGISMSVLCAIHCLSVPLLLGVLPAIGLEIVANHEFEWVMMSAIFLVAGASYWKGYQRHGRASVFGFLAAGVAIFLLVRPFVPEAIHPIATISGGLVFIFGHWKNWHWHRPTCKEPCCAGSEG